MPKQTHKLPVVSTIKDKDPVSYKLVLLNYCNDSNKNITGSFCHISHKKHTSPIQHSYKKLVLHRDTDIALDIVELDPTIENFYSNDHECWRKATGIVIICGSQDETKFKEALAVYDELKEYVNDKGLKKYAILLEDKPSAASSAFLSHKGSLKSHGFKIYDVENNRKYDVFEKVAKDLFEIYENNSSKSAKNHLRKQLVLLVIFLFLLGIVLQRIFLSFSK